MISAELTCEQVERDELDLQYLRGRLSPEAAEAFEAHFFGCDRCWDLVRTGQDLRAARPVIPRRNVIRPWMMLAAAAVVAAVGVGLWRGRPDLPPSPAATLRAGSAGLLEVRPVPGADLGAVWNIIPGAATYRIRLYTRDGALVLEREVPDTAFTVAPDSAGAARPLYWQVQALDRMGGELSRSGLVDAGAGGARAP
jgi:hypothetical protein